MTSADLDTSAPSHWRMDKRVVRSTVPFLINSNLTDSMRRTVTSNSQSLHQRILHCRWMSQMKQQLHRWKNHWSTLNLLKRWFHLQPCGIHQIIHMFFWTFALERVTRYQRQCWSVVAHVFPWIFYQGNPSCPPQSYPPRNKGLIRPY